MGSLRPLKENFEDVQPVQITGSRPKPEGWPEWTHHANLTIDPWPNEPEKPE